MKETAFPTMIRSKAARFYRFADAKELTKENHVAFNSLTYIGGVDFTNLKIHG